MSEIAENGDDVSVATVDPLDDHDKEPKKKLKSSRNVSEKKRRDKLNIYISELATMVPSCVNSQRKLDKTTVLKMTVSYMKVHNDLTLSFLGNESGLISSFLSSEELGELLDKALNGFLLVLSPSGEFVFISNSIEDLLGLKKEELLGKKIADVVHPDDRERIMREVLLQGTGTSSSCAMAGNNLSHSSLGNIPSRVSFDFRMLVKGKDGEPAGQEDIHCVGFFDHWMKKVSDSKKKSMQSSRQSVTSLTLAGNTADPLFLVGVGMVARPSFSRSVECGYDENEFTSRHSLDGKFLFIDPKSISLTGYLPFEVLGTSVYDYIHHEDLSVYSKAHESLMEYGEGKTECYRVRIKSGQWSWAKTRSYISFNHWNSKPEIYCSTTKLISVIDGENSLKDRETYREILSVNSDQENCHSRFSSLRQASIKFNNTQEANAMVLAKWAEDESLVVTSMEQNGSSANLGGEYNSKSPNKTDNGTVPSADRKITIEIQGDGSDSEARETDQEDSFELPATVEELDNFREAQRMLQNQLLEKHSVLMKTISKQKSQLQEIQRQMILNLQSQLYVDPVKLQETCSGYIERNKDLSERRQVQEQTLESITRSLEVQMKSADRRYQRHYEKLVEKRVSDLNNAGPNGEPSSPRGTEDYSATGRASASDSFGVFAGHAGQRPQQRQQQQEDGLQARPASSPIPLISLDSPLNLQQHAHIDDVQGNVTSLRRGGSSESSPRGQKAMRLSSSSGPMWQQTMPGARPQQQHQEQQQQQTIVVATPGSWQSYVSSQTARNQGFGQTFPGLNNQRMATVTETTNALSAPLLASRDISRDSSSCKLGVQQNLSMHSQETMQSPYSLGAMDSPQTFQQTYTPSQQVNCPPQLNMEMSTRVAGSSQSSTSQTGMGQTTSEAGMGFGMPQLGAMAPSLFGQEQQQVHHQQQQQQQQQQSPQLNASISESVAQLITDSSQNQQIMQVLLSVLSAIQNQPHVAATLASLLKQVQGNQPGQQGQGASTVSPQPVQPTTAEFPLSSGNQGQLHNVRPPPYPHTSESAFQHQQQQQQLLQAQMSALQNQRRPLQQQPPPPPPPQQQQQQQQQQRTGLIQHSRRDGSALGMPRVTSTTTSYSVTLHHQQQQQQMQQQQQQLQQQQQQQNEQRQLQQQLSRNVSMSSMTGSQMQSSSATMGFMPYGSMPSTSTGSPSRSSHELSSSGKRKSSNSKSDYFSNFSSDELSSLMLDTPRSQSNNNSASNSAGNNQEKKLEGEELLYNPLLTQQQQLLQLHQEQRRQLLVQQQEQRLQMFEEQRRREVTVAGQQQPVTASGGSASYSADGGLRAMLSGDAQEGTSRQTGDQNVQDSGASFSGWSESNDPLGEAEEQVLSLLLAESASYDPLLDSIDWGDETYTGAMNLNPD